MRESFKKITMTDVARRAGVSPAAVSRYFNHTGYLSPEKQEQIQRAVRELGYTLDEEHRSRYAQWKVFAIVIPPFAGAHYFTEMGVQFEKNADLQGFHALIYRPDFFGHTLLENLKQLLQERLAGIFITSLPALALTEEEVAFIANSEVPILLLSEFVQPYPQLNCLLLQNRQAADEAVRHMAAAGCRRLAFLGPPASQNKAAAQRSRGFLDAAQESGLTAQVFEEPIAPQLEPDLGWKAAKKAFSGGTEWDGLLCWSDVYAAGALWYLNQTGRKVPRQVKVMAFNDEYALYLCPPVSTMYIDPDEVTRLAVEQLSRLQDPVQRMITKQIPVPLRLIPRASTAQKWGEGNADA